jgi:paraquat-inducible protein B
LNIATSACFFSPTKINYAKEPNKAHKNTLKEEKLQVITENFMEMLLAMVNQNVQEALKKFQENKNKDYKKTKKQINELIGDLNKNQSETENTIKREINELKVKIDNIKKEVTHVWKISEKRKKQKYKTQWKATPAD